jgi:hypothetical protein
MNFQTQFFHGFGLALEAQEYVDLGDVQSLEEIEEKDMPTRPLWILTLGCFKLYFGF